MNLDVLWKSTDQNKSLPAEEKFRRPENILAAEQKENFYIRLNDSTGNETTADSQVNQKASGDDERY